MWCLAAAGWLVLSGCARSAIDQERADLEGARAAAARAVSAARLSLDRSRAYRELNVEAGAETRPAAAAGAYHESYRRWTAGEVPELPKSGTSGK